MKPALLDLNVLTALLWPAHEHHEAAHAWFARRGDARWATCALTQLGFVRILSNPAFSREALAPVEALSLLAANLAHPAHEFWPEDLPVPEAAATLASPPQGHRQLTDGYLLALAHRRNGVLATFDRGLRSLARGSLASSLELLPLRS